MFTTRRQLWPATAVILVLAVLGCSSGPKEDPMVAEWEALQTAKSTLDAKRQELADLKAEAAAPAVAEEGAEAEGEVADPDAAAEPVDNSAQIEALNEEVTALADAFMTQLVTFLNNDPILAEEGPTERQLAAIRLKSGEDMLVAQEWIDEGGDYSRAIQILENTLQLDPDNEQLKVALAHAQEMRFMSEERFATAKKGMTEEAVRAALGTPLHYNVKTYEDKGVTAWFYQTNESGSAAAVWFRPEGDELIAYLTKYDAVPGKEAP